MIDTEILQDIYTDHDLCDTQRRELVKVIAMIKQNRLIELPCAVGDKVWLIVETENGYQIKWDMVEGIHINQYASYSLSYRLGDCIDTTQLPSIPLKAFGEVIFTTKEEAEAKLKELEGDKQ